MTQRKEWFLRQLHGVLINVHPTRLVELKWSHDEPIPESPTNKKFVDTYGNLPVTAILTLKRTAVQAGEEGEIVNTTAQRLSAFVCTDN